MKDLISRQAVLDLIADYDLSMGQVVRGIHALQSVTPPEEELEKLKKEFEDRILLNQTVAIQIIDRRISELKGENNARTM